MHRDPTKPESVAEQSKHFRQLCVIARYQLSAYPELDWASVRELVKVAAAKARLYYDGECVSAAMEKVKASTRYRGPQVVSPARVSRERPTATEWPTIPREPRPAAQGPGPGFTTLGAIVEEIARRQLIGGPK